MIENHLNRLEENIMRFAKSVNFSDESFGGNITGVAMKYKLMALENKCITMERKFVASLRYQFKVLFSAWSKLYGLSQDDYLKVFYSFKRNLPDNLLEEAQVQAQLKGLVSETTRLGLFSQVDDVQFEKDEMKKEMLESDEYLMMNDPLNSDVTNADKDKKKVASGGNGEV
jgi:SPP1 family phage portal protein